MEHFSPKTGNRAMISSLATLCNIVLEILDSSIERKIVQCIKSRNKSLFVDNMVVYVEYPEELKKKNS